MLNKSSINKNCEADDSNFLVDLNLLLDSQGRQEAGEAIMDSDMAMEENVANEEDIIMQDFSEENSAIEENAAIDSQQYQGNAQIAGAALRKLTTKIQSCTSCLGALTVSAENGSPMLHSTIGFKDEMRSVYHADAEPRRIVTK